MSVLVIADIINDELSFDQTGKTVSAVSGLGDITVLCACGNADNASKEAAKTYNLNVISESIQTINNNVTRFVILKNNLEPFKKESFNKASLKFILDHQRGSLAAVLNVLSDCLLNITKIQSLPVIKTPGKYAFFVDVKFENTDFFQKAVSILKIMALEFKIIGQYLEYKK